MALAMALSGCGAERTGTTPHDEAPVQYGGSGTSSTVAAPIVPSPPDTVGTGAMDAATTTPSPASADALRTPTSIEVSRSICEGDDEGAPNDTHLRSDGLLIRLTVADRLCFGPREGIRLELAVKNTSADPITYDSDRYVVFRIEPEQAGGPAWADDCGAGVREGTGGPALLLEPGEALRFIGEYPPKPGETEASSPCHVLGHGVHRVTATFRRCAPVSGGPCSEPREVKATPASIEIAR